MKAATLAVGTEITDGQINDANSAWLSRQLVAAGLAVIEHRAVADERSDIARALSELRERANVVFVTGGLGPTSDDFTREVIAKVLARPLEFDAGSWQHIENYLGGRGIPAREIQRGQCFFPRGARILENPAGTANGFAIDDEKGSLYALPGPPSEIAAIWQAHLGRAIETLVPASARETLLLLRCLGRGESQIAEIVEDVAAGEPLRIGYRAHIPYVEVKLWWNAAGAQRAAKVIAELESRLAPWLINRDHEDVADRVLALAKTESIYIYDAASAGIFAERVVRRIREQALRDLKLTVTTLWPGAASHDGADQPASVQVNLMPAAPGAEKWLLRIRSPGKSEVTHEIEALFKYPISSERARRYITEKALILLGLHLERSP